MTEKKLAANRRNRKLPMVRRPTNGEIAPTHRNTPLMQRMEDSSLRQLWRLTNMLFRVRNGGLTLRDVKNEGTSGDVHENKGDDDKMSGEKHGFLHENAAIAP